VQRWLALTVGLAIVAVALYALVSGRADPPMGDIDAASRAHLEKVLAEEDVTLGKAGR
jgi:hypothetical protein